SCCKLCGMAEFVCKVADSSGKVFSQVEAAQSVSEAQQKLTDRGLFVYSVRTRGGIVSALSPQRRDRAVGGNDFLIFNQQFNTLIKAGLPILKALDLLAERAASPRLRPVLADVRQLVREGTALSEALEKRGVFPKVYTTSVPSRTDRKSTRLNSSHGSSSYAVFALKKHKHSQEIRKRHET